MEVRDSAGREASRDQRARSQGAEGPGGGVRVQRPDPQAPQADRQLILPGEDPAAFDALRDGLFAEWDLETLTAPSARRSRLAVNTWRPSKRATRSRTLAYIKLRVTPAEERPTPSWPTAAAASNRFAANRFLIHDEPHGGPGRPGVRRPGPRPPDPDLVGDGAALERGPSGWDRPFLHRSADAGARPAHAAADAAPDRPGRAGATMRLLAAHASAAPRWRRRRPTRRPRTSAGSSPGT